MDTKIRILGLCGVLMMLAMVFVCHNSTTGYAQETNILQLSTNELVLYPGDQYNFSTTFTTGDPEQTVEYYLANAKTKKRVKCSQYLNLDPVNGSVVALKPGTVLLVASTRIWDCDAMIWKEYTDTCQITICDDGNGLNYSSLTRALGSKQVRLKVKDLTGQETVIWRSDNKKIVSVGKKGKIKPKSTGKAVVTADVCVDGTIVRQYHCDVEITDVSLSKQTVVLEKNNVTQFSIAGAAANSTLIYAVEKPEIAVVSYDGTVYAKAEGSTAVKVKVDGKELSFVIYVTDSNAGTHIVRMIKGDTKVLVPEGITVGVSVTYVSDHPKIASVDNSGTVTALKQGNAVITASFGSESISYHVSVGNNRKALQAVEAGEKVLGSTYSTQRRMEEGYYDCSSFIFRSFAPYGYLFGCKSASDNAPVAADLALWCQEQQCVLSLEPVYDLDQLLPGDLIFYSYGGNNNRFLNIDHVAIYSGYGTIIHASDETSGVKRANYWVDNYIVMVARPAA